MTGRGAARPATTPKGCESATRCRRMPRIRGLADRDSRGWNGSSGRRRIRRQLTQELTSGEAGPAFSNPTS